MRKTTTRTLVWLILAGVLVFLSYKIIQATGDRPVEVLTSRLSAAGIKLLGIETVQADPLQIIIKLPAPDESKPESLIDTLSWKSVIHGECAKLNQNKYQLAGYTIQWMNSNGEIVNAEQVFLYPDQTKPVAPSPQGLQDEPIEAYLLKIMDLPASLLSKLEATQVDQRNAIYDLKVEIVTPNLETLNQINPMSQFETWVSQINNQNVIHLRRTWFTVRDEAGNLLVEYHIDKDSKTISWWLEKGVDSSWFSHPQVLSDINATRISEGLPLLTSTPEAPPMYPILQMTGSPTPPPPLAYP